MGNFKLRWGSIAQAILFSAAAIEPQRSLKLDRKSTRLNSSHGYISYAVFCLQKEHHGTLASQREGSLQEAPGLLPLAIVNRDTFQVERESVVFRIDALSLADYMISRFVDSHH